MYFNKNYNDPLLDAVKSVMEEKVKYPHPMYDPKSGEEVVVRSKEEHDKYSEKGWVHEKPVNEVEEPRPAGEKNFKAMHSVKKSGKNMDGSDIQESVTVKPETWKSIKGGGEIVGRLRNAGYVYGKTSDMSRGDDPAWINPKTGTKVSIESGGAGIKVMASSKDGGTVLRPTLVSNLSDMSKISKLFEAKKCEMSESEKQEKYQAFFKSALKRFGAESPAELDGDKKKEFFAYVDKNWESEDEVKESVLEAKNDFTDKQIKMAYEKYDKYFFVVKQEGGKTKYFIFNTSTGSKWVDNYNLAATYDNENEAARVAKQVKGQVQRGVKESVSIDEVVSLTEDVKDLPVEQKAIRNLKEIVGINWDIVEFDYLLNITPADVDNWKRAAMRGGWQWVNAGAAKKNVLTLSFMKNK